MGRRDRVAEPGGGAPLSCCQGSHLSPGWAPRERAGGLSFWVSAGACSGAHLKPARQSLLQAG